MRKLSELLEVAKTIETDYYSVVGKCGGLCTVYEDFSNGSEKALVRDYIHKSIEKYRKENEIYSAYVWKKEDLQSRLDWLDGHIKKNL